MKNNVKLFFKSLLSNNAAIDGARKKPWYAAVIIFFISIILSLVPAGVFELKQHLDKEFENTDYLTQEAVTSFSKYLNDENITMYVSHDKESKRDTLVCDQNLNHVYRVEDKLNPDANGKTYFVFTYTDNANADAKANELSDVSYFIFTSDSLYIKILNPVNNQTVIGVKYCKNAYKKIGENQIKESFNLVEGNETETIRKTWENWQILLRKFYRQTRLATAGIQVAILSAVDVAISLIMGFMVWVLTRGKNNPYRLFSVWECFKISFWAGLSPAILTCGFGFLIQGLAKTMFPLLLGVRVMWLSMKSLRPDGSGYAAN